MPRCLRRRTGSRIHASLATVIVAFALVVAAPTLAKNAHDFEIRALSSRPDTVTGGDVLIEVDVPQNVPRQKAVVLANGTNITSALRWDDAAHALTGLVRGLRAGVNEIAVAGGEVLFQLGVERQQLPLQTFRAILGVLEPEGGAGAGNVVLRKSGGEERRPVGGEGEEDREGFQDPHAATI